MTSITTKPDSSPVRELPQLDVSHHDGEAAE